jgi:hypothetical protein
VDIRDLPTTCQLAVEQPAMYRSVTVNGSEVRFDERAWHLDPVLQTAGIHAHLRTGSNEIVLVLDFVSARPDSLKARPRYGTEIESIYLLGDFAVHAEEAAQPLTDTDRNRVGYLPRKPVHSLRNFRLTAEAGEVEGDLVRQGYPFYVGEFVLERGLDLPAVQPGRRLVLTFPYFEAIVITVQVNGVSAGPIYASPWEVDITDALQPGTNTLRVSLTNSLRNLMGPHHHKGGEHVEVGPATFECNHEWPNIREPGEADWYDARKEGRASLWRDDYFLIPFGFLKPPVLLEITPTVQATRPGRR